MIHADELLALILAGLAGAAGPLVAWLRARKRVHDLEMQVLTQATDLERLERLEGHIVQLTAETDRVVESQEYLARAMRERLPPESPAPPAPGRVITPH